MLPSYLQLALRPCMPLLPVHCCSMLQHAELNLRRGGGSGHEALRIRPLAKTLKECSSALLVGVPTVLKPCTQVSTTKYNGQAHLSDPSTPADTVTPDLRNHLHMTDTGEGKESVAAIVARVRQGKQAKRTAKPNAKGNGSSGAAGNGRQAKTAGATAAKSSGVRTSLRGPAPGGVRKVAAAGAAKRNVSFSKGPDTVLKVREIPLGQQMKYIVDIVKARRRPVPYNDFKSEKSIVIQGPVLEQARKHPFLIVDQEFQTIQYKPKYSMSSKQELHQKIRQNPLGLMTIDLYDAYDMCEAHIKELLQDGEIYLVDSTERTGSVVYPNILKAVGDMPTEVVRGALLDVELPQHEAQIDEALKEAKIKKAKRSTPRLKMAVIQDNRQPVKKKRERQIRKLTNAHLADLFQGNDHSAID